VSDVTFDPPMDSADDEIFTIRLKGLNADFVSTINSITLSAAAAALGITAVNAVIIDDPKTLVPGHAIRFQIGISAAKHSDIGFDGDGYACLVTINFTTTNGRTLERSVTVPIKQL
jgi:hypothetical protein